MTESVPIGSLPPVGEVPEKMFAQVAVPATAKRTKSPCRRLLNGSSQS